MNTGFQQPKIKMRQVHKMSYSISFINDDKTVCKTKFTHFLPDKALQGCILLKCCSVWLPPPPLASARSHLCNSLVILAFLKKKKYRDYTQTVVQTKVTMYTESNLQYDNRSLKKVSTQISVIHDWHPNKPQ